MNKVSLFARSLVAAVIFFSVGKVEGMKKPNPYHENGFTFPHMLTIGTVYSRQAFTLAASMAGAPHWAVAGVAALGDGWSKIAYNPDCFMSNTGIYLKGMGLYCLIDAAKRYAVDFACNQAAPYVRMPSFIAQKFAYLSEPAQGAVCGLMNYLATTAHDIFTRACVSALHDPFSRFGVCNPNKTDYKKIG